MKSPLLLDLPRAHHRLISLVRKSLGGSSGTPKRFSNRCCINKRSDQLPMRHKFKGREQKETYLGQMKELRTRKERLP
jgi:hypothetical protein